jgi:hypothetical protein
MIAGMLRTVAFALVFVLITSYTSHAQKPAAGIEAEVDAVYD